MNELTNNIDVTALAEQVAEGTAEIVEAKNVKRGLSTGSKIGDAAVLIGTAGVAATLGVIFGVKHERKKWESFEEDEDEDFEEYEEFDSAEPDRVKPDYAEVCRVKPEKVDGQVEDK